jgi:hypothetical protein
LPPIAAAIGVPVKISDHDAMPSLDPKRVLGARVHTVHGMALGKKAHGTVSDSFGRAILSRARWNRYDREKQAREQVSVDVTWEIGEI